MRLAHSWVTSSTTELVFVHVFAIRARAVTANVRSTFTRLYSLRVYSLRVNFGAPTLRLTTR
jgi:hypothetical protein